jgi:hypothetical protein
MRTPAVTVGAHPPVILKRLKLVKAGMFGMSAKLDKIRLAFVYPLTADVPWSAISRLLKWQIARRCGGSKISMVVPFVDDTKIVISTVMSSANDTLYFGLYEFWQMTFVLHLLVKGDLFGDVGANAGIYSILASGVRGAKSVAIEPVPSTLEAFRLNIAINELGRLVEVLEIGVGSEPAELNFSTDKRGATMSYKTGVGAVSLFSRSTRSSPHGLPSS